jgi:hypothetical protein
VQSQFSQLTASEWQKVDTFADQCTRFHPNIDKTTNGRLRRDVPKTLCDLFLEFFPLELVECRFVPVLLGPARGAERSRRPIKP